MFHMKKGLFKKILIREASWNVKLCNYSMLGGPKCCECMFFFPEKVFPEDTVNIMKTTWILISILNYIKLLNSMDTQKHGNKEKLSVKKASL